MDLNYKKLVVKQKFEGLEAFTGIETKNKYQILNESGEEVMFVYEESNWFLRVILKKMRALEVNFIDNNKVNIMKIRKNFAFFLPEFKVFDSDNQLMATIKTKFGIRSKIEIYDEYNQLVFYIENKVMSPWTFNIFKNKSMSNQLALITKKWSGFGKEIFTDSDNFLIDFNQISNDIDKKRILALSIIIDLFVFEK